MNISEFKKGDKIVKVLPVKEHRESMSLFSSSESDDWCVVGQELEFIGIANGMIYFKREDSIKSTFSDDDKIHSILHKKYCEHWEFFVDPKTL